MAGVNSKRPKAVIVSKTAVDHAGVFLQSLPEKPKENLSLREAVAQLRDQIREALARGYSYEDLASMLTDKGIGISASTLKNYVPSGKRQTVKEQATKVQAMKPEATPVKPRGRRAKKDQSAGLESALESAAIAIPASSKNSEATPEPPTPKKRGRTQETKNIAKTAKSHGATDNAASKTTGKRRSRTAAAGEASATKSTRSTAIGGRRKKLAME